MRKFAIAFVVLGMALAAVPAFAVSPSVNDDANTSTPAQGFPSRTNDCPGAIVWDTGMFDEYTVPTGCSSATAVTCIVNAVDSTYAGPGDHRTIADDFEVQAPTAITGIKTWARYSVSGNVYHQQNPGSLHGACVKFYQSSDGWCPDGTRPGFDAIGALVYDQYTSNFTDYEITNGVPRNWNDCWTLPTPFNALPGNVYFVGISFDNDWVYWDDPATPAADPAWTQAYARVYEGAYDPYCEAAIYSDGLIFAANDWQALSVISNLPCWAGWNLGFVLYSNYVPPVEGACCLADGTCIVIVQDGCQGTYQGDGTTCTPNPCPPIPTENTSWGAIKNLYK